MQLQNPEEYNVLLTELIKKQILILGADITLATVKNVPGLEVDGWGTVNKVTGEPQVVLQNLINQFVELSGLIVKKTLESMMTVTAMSAPAVTIDASVMTQIPPIPQVPEVSQVIQMPQVPQAPAVPQDLTKTENSQDLQKMVQDILSSAQQVQQGSNSSN
jgi:hypothetical protein